MGMTKPAAERAARVRKFVGICRDADVRVTPQRLAIYRELTRRDDHPSAEAVCERVRMRRPNVALDTVYRAFRLFETLGLLRRIETDGERARFDANARQHQHFVCRRCGSIQDLDLPQMEAVRLPGAVRRAGRVESMHLEIRGLCAACLGESA